MFQLESRDREPGHGVNQAGLGSRASVGAGAPTPLALTSAAAEQGSLSGCPAGHASMQDDLAARGSACGVLARVLAAPMAGPSDTGVAVAEETAQLGIPDVDETRLPVAALLFTQFVTEARHDSREESSASGVPFRSQATLVFFPELFGRMGQKRVGVLRQL